MVRYRISRTFCLSAFSRAVALFISLSDTGSLNLSVRNPSPTPTARFYLHVQVKPGCTFVAFPRPLSEWRFAGCSFPYVMNVQLASAALPRTEPCSGSAWKENSCVLGCVTRGELRERSDLPGPAWRIDMYYGLELARRTNGHRNRETSP